MEGEAGGFDGARRSHIQSCACTCTHMCSISALLSLVLVTVWIRKERNPLSSHQSETKIQEERGGRQMEEQRGGLAGLRLMGSHGSSTKPDVHVASLSSFLEDRLQSRQGLYQSGRGRMAPGLVSLSWGLPG